jgi:hypothetical protein
LQACQLLLLPQHIRLYEAESIVLTQSIRRVVHSIWRVSSTGRAQYTTPEGGTVKEKSLAQALMLSASSAASKTGVPMAGLGFINRRIGPKRRCLA